MKYLWLTVLVLLIAGGAAWYSRKGTNYQPTTPVVQKSSPTPSKMENMKMQEITVGGTEFSFSPSTISVNKGDHVKLKFKNTGSLPHNLTITDLNIATKTIQPGESDTVEFVADKAGSYGFVCTVGTHAQKGMKGTFSVL